MKVYQITRLLTILILVCFFFASATGQTRRRGATSTNASTQKTANVKKRTVTIAIKGGETISGTLVQMNNDALRIEVEGVQRTVRLDDVTSIVFAEAQMEEATATKRPDRLSPQAKASAGEALKALRKMAGATEVGINFQEYGSRVIDAKADVEESMRQIPEGELKTELSLAMEAYVDAGQFWNQYWNDTGYFRGSGSLDLRVEPGATLQKKYSILSAANVSAGKTMVEVNALLSMIWGTARSHIDRASSLLNQ